MNIDQIIGKMMGDDSIGDEKSALEAWKKEAEENIKAIEDIRKISTLSDGLNGYQDFNKEKGWESFEKSIFQSQDNDILLDPKETSNQNSKNSKTSNNSKLFNLNRWSRIAAVAVVLFGAIFLLNNYNNTADAGFESVDYASNADGNLEVDLVDGTSILLDMSTKLRTKDERTVSLKGRAFFDVARDENQQFKINLPVGDITVLGTEFTVVADDKHTEIYVEEGSVAYRFKGDVYTLVAGEFIQVVNNNVEIFNMKDANYSSWRSKRLIFNDNTMVDVVEALSRHFNRSVELSDPRLFKNCNVKTTFDNYTLENILNEFSTTHGLTYELRDGVYVVSSSDC